MDFIEILDNKGIEYQKTNNIAEVLVYCSSGEHVDNSPSLSINLDKNLFQCWSCGFKGGIVKYLASIGVTELLDVESKQPYKIQKLAEKIKNFKEDVTISLPNVLTAVNFEFKDIDVEVLREFGAFTTEEMSLSGYLCIPVYQFGRLRFIEGRIMHMLANEPKYNRRPFKAKVTDCLFPMDKITNTNYVILVEGIFDMLNMWQLGYTNTLCIFGTNNFGATKVNMLDRMGVNRVDIMMDPDAAGQAAAERISIALDKKDISSRNIMCPAGQDPGDISGRQADRLLK